jgi:hypothetical protein
MRAEERGQEHRVQEDSQADGAHEGETREGGANEEAEARKDMAQGGSQTDGAQEAGQEDKAHKHRPDGGAYEYQVSKRRVVTEESEDDGALRAQQVREGRKPVKNGKYQRLNRLRPRYDTNWEGDTSMNGTEEGDTTPMLRKKPQTLRRQQRQDRQTQQRAKNATAAAATGNTNGSTRLTSDFTFEAQQAPSRGT